MDTHEQKYNEALLRARECLKDGTITNVTIGYIEEIFPELKESDEKVRKELIDAIQGLWDNDVLPMPLSVKRKEAWLSWLERQGGNNNQNWKPSKEEMDVLYGLAYITNQYDEHKEEVITRLYQDLKREFFNGASYENMFPNTEDDVRRKSIIQILEYARSLDAYNQYGKEDIDKNIAWLEKQGEQKPKFVAKKEVTGVLKEMLDNIDPVELEETRKEMMESMPTDKAEPKFKVGDWITDGEAVLHITSYDINYGYQVETSKGTSFHFSNETVEKKYHLWTIQYTKESDVLVDVYGNIGIIQKYDDFDWMSYCSLGCNGGFQGFNVEHENDKTHPASKEQRDLLFTKMKEAGYEWDAEKKELMKIERKPTWSEEDEHRAKDTIYFLDTAKKHYASTVELDACIDWIKSLKKRMEKEVVV